MNRSFFDESWVNFVLSASFKNLILKFYFKLNTVAKYR